MHLYVHVPFCARRCSYCDFAIAVRKSAPAAHFVDAVLTEWRAWQPSPIWEQSGARPIATVYFGGGTPSTIPAGAIARMLAVIRADRGLESAAEVTLEANPEDVTPDLAAGWIEAGVNRISLGVQSFAPDALAWMHRIHDADRPARAVAALRSAGLANLSLDLIYGLPPTLNRSWRDDLDRALTLAPDHLSLYALTVEAGTPVRRWIDRGASSMPDADQAADEFLAAHERLDASGFHHYEVSNAGRPGFESRHNRAYWARAPYLGLGPAAHSAVGDRRWWNDPNWESYRRTIGQTGTAVAGAETLTAPEIVLEEVYLGLRTSSGIPASSLPLDRADEWITAGWASRVGSRIVLTPEGWLRLDALVSRVVAT